MQYEMLTMLACLSACVCAEQGGGGGGGVAGMQQNFNAAGINLFLSFLAVRVQMRS